MKGVITPGEASISVLLRDARRSVERSGAMLSDKVSLVDRLFGLRMLQAGPPPHPWMHRTIASNGVQRAAERMGDAAARGGSHAGDMSQISARLTELAGVIRPAQGEALSAVRGLSSTEVASVTTSLDDALRGISRLLRQI
jgi:hypothetical protein